MDILSTLDSHLHSKSFKDKYTNRTTMPSLLTPQFLRRKASLDGREPWDDNFGLTGYHRDDYQGRPQKQRTYFDKSIAGEVYGDDFYCNKVGRDFCYNNLMVGGMTSTFTMR